MDYAARRLEMVETQIRARGVVDPRVLAAMAAVPRELFVPEGEQRRSYADGPLPIGSGQTISQPYIVAYMTELLELRGDETVLEIGTGSGYQTAVLAEITRMVCTVELLPELAWKARRVLTERGYNNIHYRIGRGQEGWPEHAPFDRILLTAAPPEFPTALFAQLAEGGIAVAPVGEGWQYLVRWRRGASGLQRETLIAVSFVPLLEKA